MDRLLTTDTKELNLTFTGAGGKKPSTTFHLTNLMHTMPVAVSFTTTNPTIFTFPQPFSIIPPLGTSSFTLTLSKPLDHPPVSTPPDTAHVRSTMLPIGKASQEELRKLFSKPGPHIFKDVTIPISFVGFHVVEYMILSRSKVLNVSKVSNTLEYEFMLSKAVSGCDEREITSLLVTAAEKGDGYVVSLLLEAGAHGNVRGPGGESVVALAIRSGDFETVRVLVESGIVVDGENINDRLLHDAAAVNRVDMMEVLCMNYLDLDVNSIDSEGRTPLHVAASYGYVDVLRFLIRLGSDPNMVDRNGRTAIHLAAVNGHAEAANFMLSSCSYVSYVKHAVDKKGKTAYDLAVENGHTELYDMLRLGDVLQRAARKGDVEQMRKCLAEGADVNRRDQNGWTALHRAAFKGHVEGVRVLLSHGALVDLVDGSGYTALHRAVEAGQVEVAMVLIGHGAKASMKSLAVPYGFDSFRSFSPIRRQIERVYIHESV